MVDYQWHVLIRYLLLLYLSVRNLLFVSELCICVSDISVISETCLSSPVIALVLTTFELKLIFGVTFNSIHLHLIAGIFESGCVLQSAGQIHKGNSELQRGYHAEAKQCSSVRLPRVTEIQDRCFSIGCD